MKIRPKKLMKVTLLTLIVLAIGITVSFNFAQEKVQPAPEGIPPTLTTAIPKELSTAESILNEVIGKKVFTHAQAETLKRELMNYARSAKSSFDEALKQMELFATTQGKQGTVKLMEDFEKNVESQIRVLSRIDQLGINLQNGIINGTIKMNKCLIEKIPSLELKRELKPEVLEKYQKERLIPLKLDGFALLGIAEARVAKPCIRPCLSRRWSECLACIRRAGGEAIAAWNKFVRCWDSCRWWKPWCYIKCLWELIRTLA